LSHFERKACAYCFVPKPGYKEINAINQKLKSQSYISNEILINHVEIIKHLEVMNEH